MTLGCVAFCLVRMYSANGFLDSAMDGSVVDHCSFYGTNSVFTSDGVIISCVLSVRVEYSIKFFILVGNLKHQKCF